MKYCSRCKETLSKELFGVARKRYDGLSSYCRECMKKYRLEHYHKNKKPYVERAKKLKDEFRNYVNVVKSVPCSECGIEYPGEPWLMELNHRNQDDKVSEIGILVQGGNLQKLKDEIEKCDILCVICHRRFTAIQLGWRGAI